MPSALHIPAAKPLPADPASLAPALRVLAPSPAVRGRLSELRHWLHSQTVNAARHAAAVRKFESRQFGDGPAAPKETHIRAVNALLEALSAGQATAIRSLQRTGAAVERSQARPALASFARQNAAAGQRTRLTEKVWLFYFNLFDQRTGPFADQLLAMDRIALDCYQACYMGLGRARSIPTPPPMAYVEAGYGPATYRRGVKLTRLGHRANPFPLVKLPHHRLINPWSLGAVPHEIGHNLQNDLSLWPVAPRLIERRLRQVDVPLSVIDVWKRWHKEIYADLIGVLLIGPSYISSLLDVVGKAPDKVAKFNPRGVHPTSYLRPLINTALLKRIGFAPEAEAFERAWEALYPGPVVRAIPAAVRASFPVAARETVSALCFDPHDAYGGKPLADVVRFRRQDIAVVREAAGRLADGTNPGILPERFLICAARDALERRLAPPERITRNFYDALTRR
jgi:hypothetical protein